MVGVHLGFTAHPRKWSGARFWSAPDAITPTGFRSPVAMSVQCRTTTAPTCRIWRSRASRSARRGTSDVFASRLSPERLERASAPRRGLGWLLRDRIAKPADAQHVLLDTFDAFARVDVLPSRLSRRSQHPRVRHYRQWSVRQFAASDVLIRVAQASRNKTHQSLALGAHR